MSDVYRFYVLSYSKMGERNYNINGLFGVVAKDVMQAIAICQQKEPQSTVWNVTHHGIVKGIAPNIPSELLFKEIL